MKYFLILFSALFLSVSAAGQDIINKLAVEMCNCVDTIENADSLDAKLNRCAPLALETVLENSTEEVQEVYSNEDVIEETLNKAFEMLLSVCPKIRIFVIEERIKQFYKLSSSEQANTFYQAGNDLFEKEDFKGAIKNYTKAIKKDPEFIYALDNLALAYRKSGDYKNAVKYYEKSLSLYPEGSFALQNLGAAFTNMNEFEKAIECYGRLAYYFPTSAEGYYGIGNVYMNMEDYEKAIDYIFIAHKLYTNQNSEYSKETNEMAITIFKKLKEKGNTELYYEKAKEYGITVNIQ